MSQIANDKIAALPVEPLTRLLEVMRLLRDPQQGCPWDIKQNYRSITKHTLEEAYEVVAAVEADDFTGLKEELGDLLLQVVFYAQLAREDKHFDFTAIVETLNDKLIRRHPHVFGDETIATAEAITERWEQDKARERAAALTDAQNKPSPSALDGITPTLPALSVTLKLVQRATRAGFDWAKPDDVFPKIAEELAELQAELPENNKEKLTDEFGDVLFTMVCLAHKLKLDPETALRTANRKFERRFRAMETRLSHQPATTPRPLEEWETAWNAVKADEKPKT